MIHWLRLSVKADNLQVQHLYPILPSDADRIYITYTYQTPLSHLWMHRWLPKLPKPASSSHHASFSTDRKKESRWEEGADFIPTLRPFFFFNDLPCVFSIHHTFALSLLWIPPLFLLSVFYVASLHVQARPLSLHVQHMAGGDTSPFPCPPSLFSLLFPAETIGRQDNPYSRINYLPL